MGLLDIFFGKKKAAPASGPKIDKLYTQAKALALAGEHQEAIREFQKLLALAPSHEEARYSFARVLAMAGDRSRAADEMVESIRLSGEVDDLGAILTDAETLGIALTEQHRRQLAAGLTAGLAEGRFVLLHEEPFDEEAPPLCPDGTLQSAAYRQIRDFSPFEAAVSLMVLSDWRRRDEATACLAEEGMGKFLERFEDKLQTPRFLTCYKLTDLRKYLRRVAQNPVRGTDELFYDPKSVAIIDPLRRSIPLMEDRPIEEAVLKWFAFKVDAPVSQWPDQPLVEALSEAYQKKEDEARAGLVLKRLTV